LALTAVASWFETPLARLLTMRVCDWPDDLRHEKMRDEEAK
jgi:hypothetical protein